MSENNKTEKKVDGYAVALEVLKKVIKGNKEIKPKTIKTGTSFFLKSDRFAKLIKAKDDLMNLELNIKLSEGFEKRYPNTMIKTYTKVEASNKHLGTMVHGCKSRNLKEMTGIINEAFKNFQKEHAPKKQETSSKAGNTKAANKTA